MSAMRYLFVTFCLLLAIMGCNNQTIVGNDDDPGSSFEVVAYAGLVTDLYGNPLEGIDVTFKCVMVTPAGDNIRSSYSSQTDSTGLYKFDTLPNGTYVGIFTSQAGYYQAIDQQITNGIDTSSEVQNTATLKPIVTLEGRIFSSSGEQFEGLTVYIPGTSCSSRVNELGIYTLTDAPQGDYDIAFVKDGAVNYLPVSVSSTETKTVYLKDLTYHTGAGSAVKEYSPFSTTEEQSFAIVPTAYKEGSEPQWYSRKDFSKVRYFVPVDTGRNELNAEPVQILFIGLPIRDDQIMVQRLKRDGYTVFFKDYTTAAPNDIINMDLIYTSYSVTTQTIDTLFKTAPIPLICNERNYAGRLGMAAPDNGSPHARLRIIQPQHPLAAGLKGTVQFAESDVNIEGGSPSSDADIIAVDPRNESRALIYAYEPGDEMHSGDVAPARRIYFLASIQTSRNMSPDGWKLFDALIAWAVN